jgi:PAS domain S-box-containing protein
MADRRIVDANDAWFDQMGWSRAEVVGRTTTELGLFVDGSTPGRLYESLLSEGVGRPVDAQIRRRSGEVSDFLLTAGRAEIGGETCAISAWHDVTALHRADAALRANEARFRTLIERSSDLIVLLDASGQVTFWSPSAAESLGWAQEDALGQRFVDQVRPDDQPAFTEALARLLERPSTTERVAVRVQREGAGWRSLEGLCRNLLDDPAVEALVLNLRDVTEHQELEEQYRQAQRLESIGRLAGGVAHDFNNLLTVILSCSESMKEDRAAGKEVDEEDIAEVHAAGERARDLTRQLLAFARKQVIAPVPLDLNGVVRGSEKLLLRVLGEDVRLVVRLSPDLWPALCDPSQVEQVLLNLAVNARDAMPGGGALEIETRNVTVGEEDVARDPDRRAGEWVRIQVRDTGSGMSPEVMAHLFEPFFTTKERGRGTGLGLATVHGIVAQSGGHIHVESEEGRGTTFGICFPRSRKGEETRPASRPPSTVRGDETVLVVEDDPRVRAVTVRALEEKGYRVLPAASGQEALSLARGRSVDLVVTDVVMPGMSGREVVDELRRATPGLRALFVSGYTQDAIARRGVLDSGVDFLPKPFTPAMLVARVRATLDGAGPGR